MYDDDDIYEYFLSYDNPDYFYALFASCFGLIYVFDGHLSLPMKEDNGIVLYHLG